MRLFLGLPWPAEAEADLVRRAKGWEDRPVLRLVKPENWHVTLRFLGDVAEERVGDLSALLLTWSKAKGPLTFVDRGWSVYGPAASPRVVVLKLEAMPRVSRAVESLHRKLDDLGFPGDGKPWHPHVTLAYGKGGDPGPWPPEGSRTRPPVVFHRAALYESVLTPGGSVFRELASASLDAPGTAQPVE
jgi:2'-5' RNA ligase